jgi:hypothetical protein
MNELETKVSQLNELISKGQTILAMEQFYAETVIMQENEEDPRTGKTACIEHEVRSIRKVKEMQSKLLNQAIDHQRNIVFSEWQITFETHGGKKLMLSEVSVQQWRNGLIQWEKFYYKDFQPA